MTEYSAASDSRRVWLREQDLECQTVDVCIPLERIERHFTLSQLAANG